MVDLDLSCRLLLHGWQTVYLNRSECYASVPETWPAYTRQTVRRTWEHCHALARYTLPQLGCPHLNTRERGSILLQLGAAIAPSLLAMGWLSAVALLSLGAAPPLAVLALIAATCCGGLGSLPSLFEIAAAARLDGHRARIRLLPFSVVGFLVSLTAISAGTLRWLLPGHWRAADGRRPRRRFPKDWAL
jgi:hypothetical protein